MPELPEVEVTKLGIAPFLQNQRIQQVLVHDVRLRWPVEMDVYQVNEQVIESISRRAKYLFINTKAGSLMLHLGMSGKMRVVDSNLSKQKHDHIEVYLDSGKKLVFNDPRRFGSCHFVESENSSHKLLENLGPEPLTTKFNGKHLYQLSRNKQCPVKNFIMDNSVVVGVGNIYANESLFLSGILPTRKAGNISRVRYEVLCNNIKKVLEKAITQGGTTLRDFAQADGNPGYFVQQLTVYGRSGEPCVVCGRPIKSKVIGQRNSFYCTTCQK